MNETAKIKILMLEDNEADCELIKRELTHSGIKFELKRVEAKEAFLKEIKAFSPHIILADYKLPQWDGISALMLCKKLELFIPFIFVTGAMGEEMAVECMKEGAFDYVLKDHLVRLGAIVEKAFEKTKVSELVLEFKKGMKKKYETLECSYEELKKLDESKSDFVSMLAHDLRTPVAIIKSALSTMNESSLNHEYQKHFYDMIIRATDRLARMIGGHLDLTKIEKGNMDYQIKPLSLYQVSQGILEGFKNEVEKKSITIENKMTPECMILADEDCLERILNNLIHNALKFTPPYGRIVLSATTNPKGFLEMSVSDTGCGIVKENLPELFQKYKRIKGSAQHGQQQEGIGLGLAICKELITAQGGDIWVTSQVNQGTTFTFQLPLAQSKKEAA